MSPRCSPGTPASTAARATCPWSARRCTSRPGPPSGSSSAPGDDDVVIFTRNTTDGLNLLVRAVPAGTEVVYLDIEHHADILPWQRHLNHCVRAGCHLGRNRADGWSRHWRSARAPSSPSPARPT